MKIRFEKTVFFKNDNGFTLIEVMIGLVILATMSMIMYAALDGSLESQKRVEKRDRLYQSVRMGFAKMSGDLSQAFAVKKPKEGESDDYVTGMKGGEEKINFSTMSHYHYIADNKDTDHVTVGYYLERGEGGLYHLLRRESQRLSTQLDEGGQAFVLVPNIKKLRFSYFDSNKRDWVNEWDSSSSYLLGRLPQAVKIEMTVMEPPEDGDEGKKENEFVTTVMVDMYDQPIGL